MDTVSPGRLADSRMRLRCSADALVVTSSMLLFVASASMYLGATCGYVFWAWLGEASGVCLTVPCLPGTFQCSAVYLHGVAFWVVSPHPSQVLSCHESVLFRALTVCTSIGHLVCWPVCSVPRLVALPSGEDTLGSRPLLCTCKVEPSESSCGHTIWGVCALQHASIHTCKFAESTCLRWSDCECMLHWDSQLDG